MTTSRGRLVGLFFASDAPDEPRSDSARSDVGVTAHLVVLARSISSSSALAISWALIQPLDSSACAAAIAGPAGPLSRARIATHSSRNRPAAVLVTVRSAASAR